MKIEEHPLCFPCDGTALYGILSMPVQPRSLAVLVVVGGPQYRAGSHRQFVLLARDLASHGYPVLRFDYRGMGDSEGEPRNFEQVGDDLRAGIDALFDAAPSVREVVLWGLCDGASAAMLYAHQDSRIRGLILANPWARTETGEAKALLKHYYQARMLDADLWKKIAHGEFNFAGAARSLWSALACAYGSHPASNDAVAAASLPDRLHDGLTCFTGAALVILSENDLTAQEFSDLSQHPGKWSDLMKCSRIQRYHLKEANHTFARNEWRSEVCTRTLDWLKALDGYGTESTDATPAMNQR